MRSTAGRRAAAEMDFRPVQVPSAPAAAETGPRPQTPRTGTARLQPVRMQGPESGRWASDMASFASSPSPTPLGTSNQYQVQDSGDRAASCTVAVESCRETPDPGAPAP